MERERQDKMAKEKEKIVKRKGKKIELNKVCNNTPSLRGDTLDRPIHFDCAGNLHIESER